MTSLITDRPLPAQAADLTYLRTVDRTLIHRHNLAEVFLTDLQRIDDRSFLAAAQLPMVHPHFTGFSEEFGPVEAMLLMECCRQAETCAAHVLFDVALDSSFVLKEWALELTPEALETFPREPLELVMLARTENPVLAAGELRGLDYDFEMWAAGVRIGRARMSVGYVPRRAYGILRRRGREDAPPTTDTAGAAFGAVPVEPALVGRVRATDVTLADIAGPADGTGHAGTDGSLRAVLRTPVENPSMFDHAQDHVPGMVVVEAARQLGTLAAHRLVGADPAVTRLLALDASFAHYAELDDPVVLVAESRPRAGERDDLFRVEVSVRQCDREISRVALAFALAAVAGDDTAAAGTR